MAAATATSIESSQTLIQSESHVQRTYTETKGHSENHHRVKKTKSTRKHKDEGGISVSKSSEKLSKKMKQGDTVTNPTCSKCSRPVYAMERIKAEKQSWHRECFRCSVCNKQLTVETYESDHMTLYCKSHFRQLFEPKPVDEPDDVDATPKKHQMIICESNPVELPPDVVRASDKSDPGLESLSSLDVRSRWEVFERAPSPEKRPVDTRGPKEKGAHLLAKLAKFKAKGMDIGISDEYLNGVPVEASSSEPEDEEDEDSVLKKSYAHARTEQPVSLSNMSEIVGRFESGGSPDRERHRNRKQEIQNIRSRLFMGKQAKIKEMYEQSVMQSEQAITSAEKISRELELDADKARAIKERFESGQIYNDENRPPTNREVDDPSLFKEGIAKKSRSIFLELDANAKNNGPLSPPPQDPPKRKEIPFVPVDVVRAADKVEDVHIETSDISDRFRFFETYKPDTARKEFRMTPPRQPERPKSPSPEVYLDPTVVRSSSVAEHPSVASSRQTASKMIHVFRTMEEQVNQDQQPAGPKPLKRFTPPPEGVARPRSPSDEESEASGSDEDSEAERERVWHNTRGRDEALQQAQALARTTSFRDKFENWRETTRSPAQAVIDIPRDNSVEQDGESQLETAKSLRAKFENMTVQQSNVTKTVVSKVNRFV